MGIVSKIYGQGENMCKTEKNLIWLNCFFIASLLMANVVAGKVVSTGYFIVPAAVVAYPITFLCTDIIGEIWGENEANNTVKRGFLIQIFAMILLYIAILLPSAPFAKAFQLQFEAVLSNSARFVFASLCAYIFSQYCDVKLFHGLKRKFYKQKWLRNNVSTMTSQFIDTAIFITIAFYGNVPDLFIMIVSQYVIKCIMALLDTPFFYFFTKTKK